MIIPLVQPSRSGDSEDQAVKKRRTKGAAAETETKFIEIGLQIVFWKAMIGTPNECFRIANHNMQPVEQAGTGIVDLVRKIFQGWDVTAITVAADHAVFCEGGLSKFSDGSLLDIERDLHFEMAWFPLAVQRQGCKNLYLFRTTATLFVGYRLSK